MRLVADVGGTNSRLALSQAGQILDHTTKSYSNVNWDSLYAVIADYLSLEYVGHPSEMVIAVAGPVHGNRALLTNRDWVIETLQLTEIFGGVSAHLLNDLTALGYAIPNLKPNQLQCISEGAGQSSELSKSLVVGVGTGFNVSPVLQMAGSILCPAVEAGHVSMPLNIVKELKELGFDTDEFPTVEALFSGRGFVAFCRKITQRPTLDGPQAISIYGAPEDTEITAAIDHYSSLLGHLLKDLSLAYMPSAGIYFTGSVARSVLTKSPSECVKILRRPCNILAVNNTSVWMIQDDLVALTGCAGFSFT